MVESSLKYSMGKPSWCCHTSDCTRDGEGISSQAEIVLQSLQSLEEMVSRVLSFRFPHKKLADDNFQVRPAGAKGSGGYTTNVLTMLLQLSMDARARVAAARPAMRERHRL